MTDPCTIALETDKKLMAIHTDSNNMTNSQLAEFKSNYVEFIIENMDNKTLETMCYDLLMDAYEVCTEEEVKEEILNLYDDSILSSIIGGNI